VEAKVTLDGQFASTLLHLTFQNETSERIEADFIYTLPPDTLVTSFAYWYGEEKVPARVVKKEEAAAIYAHITTRMRDPALVEMIGKHTFRARIFPVMPNSDLKVAMTLAQALPSTPRGFSYLFPLQAQKGETLDSVKVSVLVKPDASIERASNANGLPVTREAGGYSIVYSGTNIRPQRDLKINIDRRAQPLIASLTTTHAADDGYFALALTPDRDLANPSVAIAGAHVSQILQALPPVMKAHQSVTLFGRYHGSGPSTVALRGSASGKPVTFSANLDFRATGPKQTLAASLWSVRRMEQLSSDNRNRAAVIALSRRAGIPSKYTSWLAVPREEMEGYNQEIAEAKMETVARRLAVEIANGRDHGTAALRLRGQLRPLLSKAQSTEKDALQGPLSELLYDIAARYSKHVAQKARSTAESRRQSAQIDRLCSITDEKREDVLRSGLSSAIYDLANQIANRIAANRDDSRSDRSLRNTLSRLCRITGESPSERIVSCLYRPLVTAAQQVVLERHLSDPDPRRIAANLAEFHRIEKASGRSQKSIMENAEYEWTYRAIESTRDALAAEYSRSQSDARRIDELKAQFLKLHSPETREMAGVRAERLRVRADLAEAEVEKTSAVRAHSPKLAAIDQKLDALNKQAEELRARMGDPMISIAAPAGARQVVAVMPDGELKRLLFNPASGRWEARFDIPTYAHEGAYSITVIIVLADGTRSTQTIRYHVDLTAPTGAATARSVQGDGPALRLEIDGSEDTARVKALLPWGEAIELKPSSVAHRFFALAPIPPGHPSRKGAVTYILTDRAHNRTTVTVDLEQ
jgi:hypothetical protein